MKIGLKLLSGLIIFVMALGVVMTPVLVQAQGEEPAGEAGEPAPPAPPNEPTVAPTDESAPTEEEPASEGAAEPGQPTPTPEIAAEEAVPVDEEPEVIVEDLAPAQEEAVEPGLEEPEQVAAPVEAEADAPASEEPEVIEPVSPEAIEPVEEEPELLTENTAAGASDVSAASARTASWSVAVTYQNVGTAAADIQVEFYAEGSSTAITYTPPQLPAGAGSSFAAGSVSGLPAAFQGGAIMISGQPLVATVVQFAPSPGTDAVLKQMRLVANGFQEGDASNQYLVATTFLNKFDRTTVFSIQNTESEAINATVRFYDADAGGALVSTKVHNIPSKSVKIIEMDNTADTGFSAARTVFNGSAIVTAVQADGGGAARVVASASEYYTNSGKGANFEGVPLGQAAATIYMATGLCRQFGLDTFYAVQNASLALNAFIKVTYRTTAGAVRTTDGRYQIGPGQKKSISTCAPSSGVNMTGFSGSAVIESFNAATGSTAGAPIVAIGKAQTSLAAPTPATANAFTAFMSQPSGVSKIALPFIRYANNSNFNANNPGKQRTYIAIQNLGTTSIKVTVTYKSKTGATVGPVQTLTIPGLSKANSDPNSSGAVAAGGAAGMISGEFGYYTDGTFGGGAIIQAHSSNPTAKFIAIVRCNNGGGGSEDYNGPAAP